MTDKLKIALAQINPIMGDFDYNYKLILKMGNVTELSVLVVKGKNSGNLLPHYTQRLKFIGCGGGLVVRRFDS